MVVMIGAGTAIATPHSVIAASDEDPIALLIGLKGKVEVLPSGTKQTERAALGRGLMKGDRVNVAPGASATLFFNDGNVIELSEKSSIAVNGRPSKKAGVSSAAISADIFKSASRPIAAGSRETGLVALAPMRGSGDEEPIIRSPRRTDLLSDRPTLAWRAVDGATRYRITVSGDDGELWRRETNSTALPYPKEAQSLPRGVEMLWEIEALSDAGSLRQDATTIRVITTDDANHVNAQVASILETTGGDQQAASRYLAGSYLAGRGLYADAERQFQALSTMDPNAPGPHQALGGVYDAIGLKALATAEQKKAQALSREP